MTHSVPSSILGPDVPWGHDTLVVYEGAGYLTILVGELADCEVPAKLVHLVLNVCKEVGRLPLVEQLYDKRRNLRPWRVRDGVQRDVQLRKFGLQVYRCTCVCGRIVSKRNY